MKFALLGADADTLEIVRALHSSGTHQVVVAYQIPEPWLPPARQAAPGIELREDWEALLHEPVADATILGSCSFLSAEQHELRGEQLRKLAQAGVPMLTMFPACEAIVGFEIEMIRRDLGGVLIPCHPDLLDPTIQNLIVLVRQPGVAGLGRLEQVNMERWIPERNVAQLRHHLTRDTALVRQLVGGIRRVSGLGKAFTSDGGPFNLTASFDSDNEVLCTWSLCTTQPPHLAKLSLMGTEGQVVVSLSNDGRGWRKEGDQSTVELPSALVKSDPALSSSSPTVALLEPLLTQLAHPPATFTTSSHHSPTDTPLTPSSQSDEVGIPFRWMDACRSQEAAEGVERAVARGRTIELFNEEHSEAGTFKGIMAAGSCSLLLLTLFILVLGSIIEGVRLPYLRQKDREAGRIDPPSHVSHDRPTADDPAARPLWIRLWPVYPLLLFLLLQTLNLVFLPPSTRGSMTERDERSEGGGPPPGGGPVK
jgi:hypothetical protein